MKFSNIYKAVTEWLSYVPSLIFALLVFTNTIGSELIKCLIKIDCQQYIDTINIALTSFTFLCFAFEVIGLFFVQNSLSKPTINTLLVLILCNFAIHITSYSGYNREIRTGNDPPAVSIR